MQNAAHTNVRNGKLPLRTISNFGIISLFAITATWWLTYNYYEINGATERVVVRLDNSLISCNSFLQNTNRAIVNEMDEKLQDPTRREKALFWNPKAKSALILTDRILQYIQELKSDLNGNSEHRKTEDGSSYFHQSDISNGLFDSLNNFNHYLLDLIPIEGVDKLGVLPVQHSTLGKEYKHKDEWYKSFFQNLSNTATIAVLSKIEADVLLSTNIILNYLNNQSESLVHYSEFYMPLISQNSMVFLPGQTLEITAGIGVYTFTSTPTIKINNNHIPINDQGIGIYKQTVADEKGGSILITISYRDPNTGEPRTMSKSITYTVFQSVKN